MYIQSICDYIVLYTCAYTPAGPRFRPPPQGTGQLLIRCNRCGDLGPRSRHENDHYDDYASCYYANAVILLLYYDCQYYYMTFSTVMTLIIAMASVTQQATNSSRRQVQLCISGRIAIVLFH